MVRSVMGCHTLEKAESQFGVGKFLNESGGWKNKQSEVVDSL